MAKTIVGLFTALRDAQSATNDLMMNGFGAKEINIVTPQGDTSHPSAAQIGAQVGDEKREEIGKGAAEGALAGGAIGGATGLLAAAAGVAIPGLGPVLIAGPILAGLAGAGFGIAAGGIIGALTRAGIPESEAHYFAEGVRRGGTLVTVSTDSNAMASKAVDIMDKRGALDVEALADSLRAEGWTGFQQRAAVVIEEFDRRARARTSAHPTPDAGRSAVPAAGGVTFGEPALETDTGARQRQGGRIRGARYTGPERRRVNDPFYAGPERRHGT